MTWEPSLWNRIIKGNSTLFPSFLWEERGLISTSTLLQVVKLPAAIKMWESLLFLWVKTIANTQLLLYPQPPAEQSWAQTESSGLYCNSFAERPFGLFNYIQCNFCYDKFKNIFLKSNEINYIRKEQQYSRESWPRQYIL